MSNQFGREKGENYYSIQNPEDEIRKRMSDVEVEIEYTFKSKGPG